MRLLRRRSDPYAPAGPGYVPSSARDWPAGEVTTLSSLNAFASVSGPVYVIPGDRLRAAPCLMCGQAIGDAAAQIVLLAHLPSAPNGHGRLVTRGYLIHAEHRPRKSKALHEAVHRLENPRCALGCCQ